MSDDWIKCPPHECRQLDGLNKRRSQSLSSTILDYYNRYGQNRDLEKYFRYRKHHHGRSSSDDSSIASIAFLAQEKSASASHLSTESAGDVGMYSAEGDRKAVSENELAGASQKAKGSARSRSQDRINMAPSTQDKKIQDGRSEGLHLQVTDAKRSTGRKSTCSMKSKIEINITNLDLNPIRSVEHISFRENSSTQTARQEIQRVDTAIQSESMMYTTPVKVDLPISVKFVEPLPTDDTGIEDVAAANVRPTSANSSIVSMGMPNKPRLEWDSLADVGYDKPTSLVPPQTGPPQMSTLERSTLKKFFTERGLEFDENLSALDDPKLLGAKVRGIDHNDTQQTIGLVVTMIGEEEGDAEIMPRLVEEVAKLERTEAAHDPADDLQCAKPESPFESDEAKSSNQDILKKITLSDTLRRANDNSTLDETPRQANEFSVDADFDSKTRFEYIGGSNEKSSGPDNAENVHSVSEISKEKQSAMENIENIQPVVDNVPIQNSSRRNSESLSVEHSKQMKYDRSGNPIETSTGSRTSRNTDKIASLPISPDESPAKDKKPIGSANSSRSSRRKSSSRSNAKALLVLPLQEKSNTDQAQQKATKNLETKFDKCSTDIPPKPYERTTSKAKNVTTSADDTSKYDSQTSEIIQTILCSTTSNQSTTLSSTNTSNSSKGHILSDLKRGIELLDSLVESEKLNKATKKRLVKKIVKGLLKAKYNISSSTSMTSTQTNSRNPVASPDLSRILHPTPPSRNSRPSSDRKRTVESRVSNPSPASKTAHVSAATRTSNLSEREIAQKRNPATPTYKSDVPFGLTKVEERSMQWLKPMTRSEVDYERRKKCKKATKESVKLEWIQKEIQQLVALQNNMLMRQKHAARADSTSLNPIYENFSRISASDEYYCVVNKYRNSSTSTYASTKNSDSNQKIPEKYREKPKHDESSDSPLVVQAFIRNRTKLRTPEDGSDALGTYARSKQTNFLKQYQSSQEKLARDLIYARPYGDPYFGQSHHTKPSVTKPPEMASSSNTFLSSDSVSIPDMPSSLYPDKANIFKSSIAIQTSDSLARSSSLPIVDAAPPISYTITFANNSSQDQPTADPTSTMRDHLNRKKPSFIASADARRQCIREINQLRQIRNEQRQKMFLLSEDADDLRTNMQQLQPLPLTQRRVFSTRQLKAATRLRYDQLPEIVAKEAAQKRSRIRTGQRLMRDMFSRDLQRRTLRGKINLSNSMTVSKP